MSKMIFVKSLTSTDYLFDDEATRDTAYTTASHENGSTNTPYSNIMKAVN
jgi:hypothetical protein